MSIPLQESIGLVRSLRDDNADSVAHLNDQELAELAYNQTQDERLLPAAQSNALQRGINTVGQGFRRAGQAVESAIASPESPYLQRLGGRVAGNIVSGVPEMVGMVAASRLRGLPSFLTALGTGGYVYGRNKAETGDSGAALGEAAGALASLTGAIKGGRFAAEKVAGPIAKTVAGGAGAMAGSIPGDYLGMVTQPGETLGLSQLREDELGIPAYLLSNAVGDLPIHFMDKAATTARKLVESRKAKTIDLDTTEAITDVQRLAELNKKPVAERSELDLEEMKQLARRTGQRNEAKLAGEAVPPPTLDKLQEPESAIRSQLYLLNRGKKAVVELPAGQAMPQPRAPTNEVRFSTDYIEGYKTHESPVNGNTYFYDERKTTPEQIDNAVKTGTLGHLLGYGVPGVPPNPSGEVAVLRGPAGNEKVSVLLSHDTKDTVLKSLGEMALGEDKISVESPEQVMEWRRKNQGLVRLYSIAGGDETPTTPKEDISFTNHVLNMFSASTQAKHSGHRTKGPKFELDAQGQLGGKGLLRAIREWAPAELWEHYKSRGIETLLNPHNVEGSSKVNAQQFAQWLRENTPEVEIKKLIPSGTEDAKARIRHEIETLGFSVVEDDEGIPHLDRPAPPESSQHLDSLLQKYQQALAGEDTDAATGRYGVEPKELSDMPGAVDILVRVPRKLANTGRRDSSGVVHYDTEKPLFVGPHFGKSDINVIGHVRGYMEILPGKKIFHVFELQGDQAQLLARWREKVQNSGLSEEAYVKQFPHDIKPGDHPLLAHYETLLLKTAIQHARAEGATHIAISDGETAMMTEGHDRQLQNITNSEQHVLPDGRISVILDGQNRVFATQEQADRFVQANAQKSVIPQEPGMRAAYDRDYLVVRKKADKTKNEPSEVIAAFRTDQEKEAAALSSTNPRYVVEKAFGSLPAIAKKLTGESGSSVNFGVSKKATRADTDYWEPRIGESKLLGSPVFRDVDGKPKTDITARLYDITNPSESVKRLFSIYDAQEQTHFEQNIQLELDKLDQGLRDSQELSPRQLLERGVQGDKRVEMDALVNLLAGVRGTRGALRVGTFLSPKTFAVMDVVTRDIKFNKDLTLKINEMFGKYLHELTHGAVLDMSKEEYGALRQQSLDLGQPARLSILTDLAKQFKMGKKFDPEYLSGAHFDPTDPHYPDRVTHEFSAGLMEIAAEAHFQKVSAASWMQWLPSGVQRLLMKIIGKVKALFSDNFPSVSAILEEGQAARLNGVVDSLQRSVISAEQANLSALLNLRKSSTFDESTYLDNLVDSKENFKSLPRGGDGELYSFASDLYDKVADPIKKRYENLFFPAMWRARDKPYTLGHFLAMHGYRPANLADLHTFESFLGQDETNSLSRDQARESFARSADKTILDVGISGERFRKSIGKIQEENQNRREASKTNLTDDQLVTAKDMVEKYGLDPAHIEFAKRLIKVPSLIAEESHKKGRQVDVINLTRLFYGANKTQDLEGVRQKITRINQVAEDFGRNRYQMESWQRLAEKWKDKGDPEMQADAEMEVQRLTQLDQQAQQSLSTIIRQEFAGAIPMKLDGPDPFSARMSKFILDMSARRAQYETMTKSAGWASMTRRGRWRLRVWDSTYLGDELGTVKEYRGFHTEKELMDYVAKQGLTDGQFEKMDMHEIKDRVKAYSPSKIERAQEQAWRQVDEAIAEVKKNVDGLTPEQVNERMSALSDFKAAFNPLAQEMKDVISVKGDKFAQKRQGIAGYNTDDFLPNTFEYMQFMTVRGNKALAQAESNLQISRKELDNQPDLRDRMKREQQYVLSNQEEWNAARKFVFYYYLGAAPRHLAQNAVQIPLNGISQMVAEGSGLAQSYGHFGKAAILAAKYSMKGTTGDATIDILLKQADKDGVSFSTAIEAPTHDNVAIQNILDSISAHDDGKVSFGTKIKLEGTKLWKGFEKFLQATSAAAESANRKTTFIASILADRAKGESNSRTLYNKASQFTNFVNFVGDKPNRPGYMIENGTSTLHGPLGLMTALQSFTTNHIAQLYSFYQKGFRQGSSADKRAFAVGLAHLLAFSGSLGMVGAATAEQLFEELTGISLKTAVRTGFIDLFGEGNELAGDRAADTVLGGFPALLGFDMTSSIGLGNPFVRYQAGEPLTLEQFAGPAAGLAGRVVTGVGKVTEDPFNPQAWWDATRSAAPSFLSHAIRVYDLLNRSSTLDKNQQPVTDPLSASGSIATVAGFTPMETAKQREFNTRDYRDKKKGAEDYERNVLRISQLLFSAEQSGDRQLIERAREMMGNYVDSTGGLQDRDSMVNSIVDQLQQTREKVTPAASIKGSAARQRLEDAFPSIKVQTLSAVDTALLSIEVAQLLGQDDVSLRSLMSLSASLPDKVLDDMLKASGLRPEEAGQFLQPGKQAHFGPSR